MFCKDKLAMIHFLSLSVMSIPTVGFSEAAVHSLWLSSETILLTHCAYYIKEILSKKDKKVCIFMQPFLYFFEIRIICCHKCSCCADCCFRKTVFFSIQRFLFSNLTEDIPAKGSTAPFLCDSHRYSYIF